MLLLTVENKKFEVETLAMETVKSACYLPMISLLLSTESGLNLSAWLPFLTESEIKIDLLQETSSEAPGRVNHSHLDPQNILSMVLLACFYYSYA